jgi:hypothetical protein
MRQEIDRTLTMDKLLALREFSNLDDYINNNFSYIKKYEDIKLYIVATTDLPKFTYFDTHGLDIHRAIIEWVELLILNNTKKDTIYNRNFRALLNNYVIAYGNYNYLKKKTNELFIIYKKILIPIYDTDYLHFKYTNDFISNPYFSTINWKPIKNDKLYNQIIEIIMFFIFDLLVILYPSQWSYLRTDYIYKTIYYDIDNGNYEINNYTNKNEILKTYIYQTWLIYIHSKNREKSYFEDDETFSNNVGDNDDTINGISNNWTIQRHDINKLLELYKDKGIPYDKDINLNFSHIYQEIEFEYNYLNWDDEGNTIMYLIIGLFAILILFIITIYLYFKIVEYNKLDAKIKNPLRFIMNQI